MAKETINNGNYTEDNIKTLEWNEHIRRRAGMYVGRLGNGDDQSDGIYVLLKEVVDNSIDEFAMGFGKQIQIRIEGKDVTVRDLAADIAKAMDALGIGKADVFGVSQGGMIAQYLAIDRPDKVGKLVLAVTLSRNNATVQNVVGDLSLIHI